MYGRSYTEYDDKLTLRLSIIDLHQAELAKYWSIAVAFCEEGNGISIYYSNLEGKKPPATMASLYLDGQTCEPVVRGPTQRWDQDLIYF